jgi:hypothetical protein
MGRTEALGQSLARCILVGSITVVIGCGHLGYKELDLSDKPMLSADGPIDDVSNDDLRSDARQVEDASSAEMISPAEDVLGDASLEVAPEAGCADSAECSCSSRGGHDYRFCTATRSWTDSEAQCQAAGMFLSRVDDAVENAWIRSSADARGMGELWIGVEDPTQTLHWQWPDGTEFWSGTNAGGAVGGLYSSWYMNSPSGNPNRNCGSMLSGVYAGQWSDRSCASLLAYVCERN